MLLPLFPPTTDWKPNLELPDPTLLKTVAIDLETRDPNLMQRGPGWFCKDGYAVGYAVAWEGGSTYLPIRHHLGENIEGVDGVMQWIEDICLNAACIKVMHNALYDCGWLRAEGFKVNGTVIDTMFMAALLDEHSTSLSLDATVKRYCPGQSKDTGLLDEAAKHYGLKNPRGELWKLPGDLVGVYAENDAIVTLAAYKAMLPLIATEDLEGILDLECSLLPLLLEMRAKGIRVDLDKAEQAGLHLRNKEQLAQCQLRDKLGFGVDVWSSASIAQAFNAENLKYGYTEEGAPSFTAGFLESIAETHWLPSLILEERKYSKAAGTFIDGMIYKHQVNGRIHTELHPLKSEFGGGTISGRFSSRNPNLQQVPANDKELTHLLRGLFLPEEGETWASIDYSQQEPRMLVSYANKLGLTGIAPMVDAFRTNPKADFYELIQEGAGIGRKESKILTLASFYGIGGVKFCQMLDLDTDYTSEGREIAGQEGQELLAVFRETFPFVGELNSMCSRRAETTGVIKTILGRHCRFPRWEPAKWQAEYSKALPLHEATVKWPGQVLRRAWTHKALNRLVQGSSADQTKKAMLDIWKAGGRIPLLQIHDEVALSVANPKEAEEVAQLMLDAVELSVPSRVDIEYGRDWGHLRDTWEEAQL